MKNLLLSEAIGDIAGSVYEFDPNKNYDEIVLDHPRSTYTDDTVCTFACAEALLNGLDMSENLARRCLEEPNRGYGGRFAQWLLSDKRRPYHSFGNGSAMRCSAAAFLAKSPEDCAYLATLTALPSHNHPEGVKGAVASALATFYLLHGGTRDDVRTKVLEHFYPAWTESYDEIKPDYYFDETCQLTVPAALICLLESKDYADSLRLAIALGGDADTLGAIVGPMAYALYREMPTELIEHARALLPQWMLDVSDKCDAAAAL